MWLERWNNSAFGTPGTPTLQTRNWGTVIVVLTLAATALGPLTPTAFGQTEDAFSIRVESKTVLVPTFVYQKDRMRSISGSEEECQVENQTAFAMLLPSQPYLPPKNCDDTVMSDLIAKDFTVLEDGLEQRIQSLTHDFVSRATVRDNYGYHSEWSLTPRGKWSSTEATGVGPGTALNFYLLAYTPPPSREGSCHQVNVKVSRKNAAVFARDNYCNVRNPASDPLSGTKFGEELVGDAKSTKPGKLELSFQMGHLFTDSDSARVYLSVEFPWKSLWREWKNGEIYAKVGIAGIISRKDGTGVAQFSDVGIWPTGIPNFVSSTDPDVAMRSHPEFDQVELPSRYETQLELPPGDYEVQLALSDSRKFGQVRASMTVDAHAGKQLALSSLLLCKRFRDAGVAAQESAAWKLAPGYIPLVSNGLELAPAGNLHFSKGERLFAYFEVFQSVAQSDTTNRIKVHMRLVDSKTETTKKDFGEIDTACCRKPGAAITPMGLEVTIDKVPTGSYRLEIQAENSSGDRSEWRRTDFTVE